MLAKGWRRLGTELRKLEPAGDWLLGVAPWITTFLIGALIGVLLTTLSIRGWPAAAEDDLGGDKLVVLSGRDDSAGRQRERLIATWNRLHPRTQATIVELRETADEQLEEMQRRAQSRDPEDAVDVYNLDVTWTAEFAAEDRIRRLEGADTDGFLDKPLETCRYRGALWALPFNTDAGLLYYRYDQLRAHGISAEDADLQAHPPASWEDLRRLIKRALAATRSADDPLTMGYVGQFFDYEGLTVNAMEAVWAEGGEVVDEDGDVRLDERRAREAMQQLAAAFEDGLIPPAARGYTEDGSTRAFADQHALFMRNWPVAYRTLTGPVDETGAPTGRTAAGDVRVTRLPGPSVLGGQNLAVATKSRHPEAARRLVEFLTGETSQQILFQDGGLASTRVRTYEDPAIAEKYGYAEILLDAVQDAELRPVTPYYAHFSEVFRRIVGEILTENRDPDEADVRALQRALEGK